jgi:hypothetical protein
MFDEKKKRKQKRIWGPSPQTLNKRKSLMDAVKLQGKDYLYFLEEAKLEYQKDNANCLSFIGAFVLDYCLLPENLIQLKIVKCSEVTDRYYKYMDMRGYDYSKDKNTKFLTGTNFSRWGIVGNSFSVNGKWSRFFIINKFHELSRFDKDYKKWKSSGTFSLREELSSGLIDTP